MFFLFTHTYSTTKVKQSNQISAERFCYGNESYKKKKKTSQRKSLSFPLFAQI